MKSPEFYKEQIIRAAEDAGTHYEVGSEDKWKLFKQVFHGRTNTEKAQAAFRLVREFLPNNEATNQTFEKFFHDPSLLPFNTEHLKFGGKVGTGGQGDVFLLESQQEGVPSYVIKMVHYMKGGKKMEPLERAKALRDEYESVKEIYAEVPEVVPKEFTIVTHNVMRHMDDASAGLVQRFYGRDIQDFFTGISKEELLKIANQEPEFRRTLAKFIDVTFQRIDETGEVVDILGDKNLAIVKNGDNHQLLLLDPHVTFSTHVKNLEPLLGPKLQYMRELTGALQSREQLRPAA